MALQNQKRYAVARQAYRRAEICRLPAPRRWALALLLWIRGIDRLRSLWNPSLRLLLAIAPNVAFLRCEAAMEAIGNASIERQQRGWRLLMDTLPLTTELPLLLEDLMLLALSRLESGEGTPQRLGVQEHHPEIPYIFEEALALLMHRFGDPRIPWDRTRPARYLAAKGRHLEALALVQAVPPMLRSRELWETMIQSLRALRDPHGLTRPIADALARYSDSHRLWMEKYQDAMDHQRLDEALDALEQAGRLIPPGAPPASRLEWSAQRANYAFWMEHDPEKAWQHLQDLPWKTRGGAIQLLGARVLLELERYEEAQEILHILHARNPQDPELHLLQAEALAGLEAWEALLPYLDQHQEALKSKARFWHLQGLCHAHLKDPVKAREHLERAAYMDQSNLDFILDAGHACMELSEFVRAEQHWRQALKLDERSEEALIQLAESRRCLHDEEGAKRLLRECLLYHPESEEAQHFLAELEAN